LPADLDVVLWVDVERVKQLWLRESEQQLLRILVEYGVFPGSESTEDLAFGLGLLEHTKRLWIACRPQSDGCEDPVVLLRGDFNRFPLRKLLPKTNPGLDLGGGWLRYDRDAVLGRSGLSRVYFAPPDRILLVSTAELDAVERALDRSRGSRSQIPQENGLISLQLRPSGIARVLEKRSAAAARWLREARSVELRLLPRDNALSLEGAIVFETQERAERAASAFRILWTMLTKRDNVIAEKDTPLEVVGDTLVLRLLLNGPPAEQSVPSTTQPAGVP
jgi:hypothetical protein